MINAKLDYKAVHGRFAMIEGKSERLYQPRSAKDGIDVNECLSELLRHPQVMNMPSVFILDADKPHRDAVIDQWVSENNIGVNIIPGEQYLKDAECYERMAIDIRIGTEATLFKLMQKIVLGFPEHLRSGYKTSFECERSIGYPMRYWGQYRPILIVRDIENFIGIKRRNERQVFGNILKSLYNELHCSFIITGTQEGAHALNVSGQFSWRFLDNVIDFDYHQEDFVDDGSLERLL